MNYTAHRFNTGRLDPGTGKPFIEMSRAALLDSLDSPVICLEHDGHELADTDLAAMHDETAFRTTGVDKYLSELTKPEYKKLRLLDHDGEPTDEAPMLVSEVVDMVGDTKSLVLEVKHHDSTASIVNFIKRSVPRARVRDGSFRVMSFWHDELVRLHEAVPELETDILYWGKLKEVDAIPGIARYRRFNMAANYIRPGDVEVLQARGLDVQAFTVNKVRTARKMAAMGLTGLISDKSITFKNL